MVAILFWVLSRSKLFGLEAVYISPFLVGETFPYFKFYAS